MTKVIRHMGLAAIALYLLTGANLASSAQTPTEPPKGEAPGKAAETLYFQLRSVGLDKQRVYRVRDASFNRGAIHITLDDGAIAFTEDVAGHVTGAFFQGEGEVLLLPPDQAERASMMLFTGAAILEERFSTAYFRFNDKTFSELMPSLRRADELEEFATQWNLTAKNLAAGDALRLLLTFSRSLPVTSPTGVQKAEDASIDDHFLHARLQGEKLGNFDVAYDSVASEQVWVGQLRTVQDVSFYDMWASFAATRAGAHHDALNTVSDEGKSGDLTISRFKIKADVHPPTEISAEAWLEGTVHQGGQRAVLFELSRALIIQSVDAEGLPLEFIHNPALEGSHRARLGNDLVALVFPAPLQAGQQLKLHFLYSGNVLSEAGNGLLYVGAHGTWYPNRGLAMADYDLEFHTPPGWTLLATGKRVEKASGSASDASSEQVTHWVSERPIPVAGFNLGRYTRATAKAGEMTVETYAAEGMERTFPKAAAESVAPISPPPRGARPRPNLLSIAPPPPSPARNAQVVADRSAQAIEFFEKRFGPYPYTSLALTQFPGVLSQGWPGLIFLSSFSFLTPAERQQLHMPQVNMILSEGVIAHETAHQWWGDLVGWSGYRDQWIVEGLANYCSLMLLDSENPEQFRTVMEKYREGLLEKNKQGDQLLEAGPVTLGSRLSSSHFPDGYEAISYGRGTWLFHMLRNMMRDAGRKSGGSAQPASTDEPFVRALLKVRNRYEGKSITTRDLLQVFEEELPPSLWYEDHKSLDWFFQGWVNGTAVPRFDLQGVKYADKGTTTLVTGTITEKFAPKDLVTPVPVYAVVANKSIFLGQVFVDGLETPFHLTAPTGTRRIVLDPAGTLLTRR